MISELSLHRSGGWLEAVLLELPLGLGVADGL